MATACVSIETPYTARYRVTGRADWACPFCGHVNSSRLHVGQAYIYCKGRNCGRRYGNGHLFYVPMNDTRFHPRLTPPDYILPATALDAAEPMPAVPVLAEPPMGAPFHRVVMDAMPSDDTAK